MTRLELRRWVRYELVPWVCLILFFPSCCLISHTAVKSFIYVQGDDYTTPPPPPPDDKNKRKLYPLVEHYPPWEDGEKVKKDVTGAGE